MVGGAGDRRDRRGHRCGGGRAGAGGEGRGGIAARATPVRTCIGCRRTAPVDELVRVVAGPDGALLEGRSRPGRGAWLCAGSADCLDAAARKRAFSRALRTEIDSSAVEALRTAWAGRGRIEEKEQYRPPAGERT
ncbi:MAG TPA: YlxR family protein [Acidimicrobiales bacterium]